MVSLLAALALLAAAPVTAAPAAPAPDPAFAGHYYLADVTEVGSELVLNADGSFAWMLSYGDSDQAAQGHWVRDGDTIVLSAKQPAHTGSPFSLGAIAPWNAQAEEAVLELRRDAAEAVVRARCPFLTDGWVSTTPLVSQETAPPSPEVLRARAAATLATARAARVKVEELARQVMAGQADKDAVQPVLGAWIEAADAATHAAADAGLPLPPLAGPRLPAACDLPPPVHVGPAARWTGGIGVQVRETKGQELMSDVTVELHFADGTTADVVTGGHDLAVVPGPLASALTGVRVRGEDGPPLTLAPLRRGVVTIEADPSKMEIIPPFESFTLTIKGHDLVRTPVGEGRYVRQP